MAVKRPHYLRREPLSGAGIIWLLACGVVLLPAEDLGGLFGFGAPEAGLFGMFAIRFAAFAALLGLAVPMGYRIWRGAGARAIGACLPFFLVALNNFPWIALATGAAAVTAPPGTAALFGAQCLAVAAFEELVFRGMILPLLLERARGKVGIFWALTASAAIFGATHLVNLLGGAGFGAVAMQIGYSFLIGLMCGLVLLASRSLPLCILLHALFNAGGLLIETLGRGAIWDAPTVVLTAVIAVTLAGYGVLLLLKTPAERLRAVLGAPQGGARGRDASTEVQDAGKEG